MTRFGLPPGSIVVGVDGSEDAGRAVTWAAVQAALERRVLALVRSTDQLALRDTAWLDAQGIDHRQLVAALRAAAQDSLAAAATRAAVVAPGIEVVTALVADDPRITLTDLSAEAQLVVLGSRGRGPVRSTLLGSVGTSVARHARCPVVVCRPPAVVAATPVGVVVGADGSGHSVPVLEFAFAQASLRQAPLTVMHCFKQPDAVDGAESRRPLAQTVADLTEKFPDVEVTTELTRGLVDECLADRSPAAGLLVIGRSADTGRARFLHASCAVAVLERARTAVAVVPEP